MSTSEVAAEPVAVSAKVTRDTLVVELRDGRVLSVPLAWYPRLAVATATERRRWQLIGPGIGIHWPLIDEDVSIEALMAGQRSTESATSLRRWEASRRLPHLIASHAPLAAEAETSGRCERHLAPKA